MPKFSWDEISAIWVEESPLDETIDEWDGWELTYRGEYRGHAYSTFRSDRGHLALTIEANSADHADQLARAAVPPYAEFTQEAL